MTCRSAGRGTRRSSSRILAFAVMLPALTFAGSASAETWRRLTVKPEHRCSPYERKRDYPYSQSVEQDRVHGRSTTATTTVMTRVEDKSWQVADFSGGTSERCRRPHSAANP